MRIPNVHRAKLQDVIETVDDVAYVFEQLMDTFEAYHNHSLMHEYNDLLRQARSLQGHISSVIHRR